MNEFRAGVISIIIFFIALYAICHFRQKQIEDNSYYNMKGVIVQIGTSEGPSHGKYRIPTEYHKILVRDLEDTTLYAEWDATKEKYYNYHIGDTVYFGRICKDRYFRINSKK